MTEYTTHFSLWAAMKAPLLVGCDVRAMDNDTKTILLNEGACAECACHSSAVIVSSGVLDFVSRGFSLFHRGDCCEPGQARDPSASGLCKRI